MLPAPSDIACAVTGAAAFAAEVAGPVVVFGVHGAAPAPSTHLLHFEPLAVGGASLDVPCDPQGHVGLDGLGERLRNDYFFARTLVGRLFATPTVRMSLPPSRR